MLVFFGSAAAQDMEPPVAEMVYKDSVVDVHPEFQDGIENFYTQFYKRFKKPPVPSFVDKLMLSFIVEKDGSLSEIKVIHDVGFGCGYQAVQLLEQFPNWSPGKKDGKPVRTLYHMPIAVVTED